MNKATCSNCEYCTYFKDKKTDVYDVALYKCTNRNSKKYRMIIDVFHLEVHSCDKFEEENCDY